MWTVNIVNHAHGGTIPSPDQWWPGGSYVNWVGIDGYYLKPTWKFAPLFGPTITDVQKLTLDPILVAETGAVPAAGQPAKIADLFSGIHQYGLLGFVWFNSTNPAACSSVSPALRPLPPSARAPARTPGPEDEQSTAPDRDGSPAEITRSRREYGFRQLRGHAAWASPASSPSNAETSSGEARRDDWRGRCSHRTRSYLRSED